MSIEGFSGAGRWASGPPGCCGVWGAPGLCGGGSAGGVVNLRCSAMRLCSVTFRAKGLPLRIGEGARCWVTGLTERWPVRLAHAGAAALGVSVGGRLSLCSRSELASFTGERLDRKDLACSAASTAFFLAAFFSSCWSLRLSLRGFGSVGGGERWWWVGAGWTEDETVISIVISWKEAQSLG